MSLSPPPLEKVWHLLRYPREAWPLLRAYLGIGGRRRQDPITDAASLARFLESRASFVTQTSLYGYLRTRAGQRYPELFDDPGFVRSINIAKWQIWLACLSDLAIYAGGFLGRLAPHENERVGRFMRDLVEGVLAGTDIPGDSGPDFAADRETLRQRLAICDWFRVPDDGTVFKESPPALVKWAPIIDQLKELDEPIVLNSVRFRWQGVRRELRMQIRSETLLAAALDAPSASDAI